MTESKENIYEDAPKPASESGIILLEISIDSVLTESYVENSAIKIDELAFIAFLLLLIDFRKP